MKKGKDITPIDFAEYFRKLGVSENNKVYWNEMYCYISQSSWDVKCLKRFSSHWLLVEVWRLNWMIKAFVGVCPSMPYVVYYAPALLRGQTSFPCHDFLLFF